MTDPLAARLSAARPPALDVTALPSSRWPTTSPTASGRSRTASSPKSAASSSHGRRHEQP